MAQKEILDKVNEAGDAVVEFMVRFYGGNLETMTALQRGFVSFLAGTAMVVVFIGGMLGGLVHLGANYVIAPVVVAWLENIESMRRESTPGTNAVILATMSEMFGVEFDTFDLPAGSDRKSVEERAVRIGSKISEMLEREFTQGGGLSPEQGEKASKMFTGFSANFAIASAFTALVGELATGGQVEAFGEFGVELAENLGLGRMARGGLRELVATTVATPYEWFLNRKYRPTILPVSATIEAYFKGNLSEAEFRELMSWHGYSEPRIDALVANARPGLPDGDLSLLMRFGVIDRNDAIEALKARGLTPLNAERTLRANELSRVSARVEESINFAQTLTRSGVMPLRDFGSYVDTLPLLDEEKHELKVSMGEIFEHPRKQMSLAQMKDGYIEDVLTLGDYEQYLDNEGYSRADVSTLIQLLLIDAQREKEKRAAALAAKLKSKAVAVTLGQLRQAFIDGLVNLPEWEARLVEFGYNTADRQILTLQVLVDKAEEDERRRRARERDEERERARIEKAGETPPQP